ncbi:murein L,D-transpeptidase catalytic domain family protein [Novosphingobium sp. 1949]|uniref:Murein L,D-transpeptidase catalytic domain family protein n=1 Tax=Novosphingobium organovorum TaxID=2930092 RepID=A0ABT0BH84_9SPHN|nr:murein L,D-transpeptidase catalytic domain family protein [Novosphingobium organovorum]MCJ2184385.1 murein L,D-transpeptidase catalytic domain family protein [Novosphingobium organovorum]
MGRRHFLHGSLGAGLALALPARALAIDTPLGTAAPAGATVPASALTGTALPGAPATVSGQSAYERRLLDVAARQAQRVGNAVWRKDVVGLADFALPSWKPRLHFANLEDGTVRSFLLAHGRGSDPQHSGWLQSFSNQPGSFATSRGAFLTCEWYKGKYGTSIRLVGLDPDNSLALERAIVMHPAWYVDETMIDKWGKLGRSEGCFAMSNENFSQALWHLSGGRLLFADRIGEG